MDQSQVSLSVVPRQIEDVWAGPYDELPHVVLIVDGFPKALGGGERIVLRLAELLPHYGFRASVLTFSIHPESSILTEPLPFPVYLVPLERTYDLKALRAALAIGRFLRQQKVQIVQTFFESSDLWAGAVAKTLSSARLIWSRRDMGILRAPKHRIGYRLMAGVPDLVFTVSDSVRRHVIEVDRVDPSQVCTIYSGLDLPYIATNVEADFRQINNAVRFAVTTVGNIRRVKGHDVLIKAAALVLKRFPETSFSIAGEILERGYHEELQHLVRELGIQDRFLFVGSVANTWRHLRQADVFVLPSRSEGFSNAILEAMACSLPVVASDVGGNREAVQHGRTGLIVPPDDPPALAEAIALLVSDRTIARSMGAAGRVSVEEKFTTNAMMSRIATTYRTLLAGV